MNELSVVIPNWNGAEHLDCNLPKLYKFLRNCEMKFEIIVVDDASTDDSTTVLSFYPYCSVIYNKKNIGFAKTVNKGVGFAQYKYVFILSNDIILDNTLEYLTEHFTDPDVFAVMPQVKWVDSGFYAYGKRGIEWNNGLFHVTEHTTGSMPVYTLFASGGSGIYDRAKFLELGGFDSLYEPFYWEEIDISYCAWKRGYKVIYDPRTFVWNTRRGVIKQYYSDRFIKHISGRNSYLFLWKNITHSGLIKEHLKQLIPSFFMDVIQGKWRFPLCLISALLRLPQLIRKRHIEKNSQRRSDPEVFALVNSDETVCSMATETFVSV